ncbi:MAG: hypothetical protein ACOYI8_06465 [Christensenellales bacterium]|jgi:hypothetical protein
MKYVKCPRCELNYITESEKLCSVCRKEVSGETEQDDIAELCSECGENPVVSGSELCLNCLKELAHRMQTDVPDDALGADGRKLEIACVSGMDEMVELDIEDGIDDAGYKEVPLDEDDEDDEDEDEN